MIVDLKFDMRILAAAIMRINALAAVPEAEKNGRQKRARCEHQALTKTAVPQGCANMMRRTPVRMRAEMKDLGQQAEERNVEEGSSRHRKRIRHQLFGCADRGAADQAAQNSKAGNEGAESHGTPMRKAVVLQNDEAAQLLRKLMNEDGRRDKPARFGVEHEARGNQKTVDEAVKRRPSENGRCGRASKRFAHDDSPMRMAALGKAIEQDEGDDGGEHCDPERMRVGLGRFEGFGQEMQKRHSDEKAAGRPEERIGKPCERLAGEPGSEPDSKRARCDVGEKNFEHDAHETTLLHDKKTAAIDRKRMMRQIERKRLAFDEPRTQ